MAGKPVEPSELEQAVIQSGLEYSKVSADMWEVSMSDGSKATVSLKAGLLDCPRSKDLKE
jgi:hypothetical protein